MENNQTGKDIKLKISLIEFVIRILIFAVLAVVTVIALRPLQLSLRNRMEIVRDNLISQAENSLGRRIQYDSIGPSIFGVLDIRNIIILREDDSVFLNVSRLRLSYSLLKFLRGNLQDTFNSVRIDKPVLSLDFKKDADLVERLSSLREQDASYGEQNETWSLSGLLPENFSFRIWDGAWELSDPVGTIKLQGVGLDASVRQNSVNFQGRWNAAVSMALAEGPGEFLAALENMPEIIEAVISGRIQGVYSGDTKEGSAAVTIPSFAGSFFRLKPLTIGFFLSDKQLEIRKTHDKSPAAISLVYELETGKLNGRFEAENFSPGELLAFTGPWKDYNPALAFRISGIASLERESSGALTYGINLSGRGLPGSSSIPASLDIIASGGDDRIVIDTFDFSSAYGALGFSGGIDFDLTDSGPIAPYGFLSLSNFRIRETKSSTGASAAGKADGSSRGSQEKAGISGEFFINTNGREISIFCENLSAGDETLSALDLFFLYEEQGLSFSFSALSFKDIASDSMNPWENIRMGTISLEGSIDYVPDDPQTRHIQSSLRLDSFSIGAILSFLEPLSPVALPSLIRSAANDLSVTTEVFFTTDYQQILYNAPRIVAAYEGLGNVLAIASLSGTSRGFELSEGQISWEKGTAGISCSVDFSDTEDISFSLGAAYKDLTYFFEGMIIDQRDISIRGSYGFQVYLSAGATGAYSGYAQGDNLPIPSGNGTASLGFLLSLFYVSPASWLAEIERFEISGMTTPASSAASLRFYGAASETGMIIPSIYFDDGRGLLTGDISVDWDSYFSYYRFRAEFFGANRGEYYALNGEYRGEKLELDLSGHGMQLSRISGQNAVLDASFRLSWESIESFEAEAAVSSFVLNRQDGSIRASVEAVMNNDMFIARQIRVNYSGLEASLPYFSINRAASRADTEALILGNLSGIPLNILLHGEARYNSADTWRDLLRDFDSLSGVFTVNTAIYNTVQADEPFDLAFACVRREKGFAFNIDGGPRNMIRFRYESEAAKEGVFYAALSAPSPVRGSITGAIVSENIDAQVTDLYVDLSSLWRFIPPSVDVVMFPCGIVTGSVRIAGSLEDPEFYGTVRGVSVQILVPEYLPKPICPVPTVFTLSGNEMTFGPVDAVVGEGSGWATAWFRFDQWVPNIFSIDIQVPPESPIPYDFDISGLLAHGLVSGRLIVAMEYPNLYLTGDLVAHNTEISLNLNEISSLEGGWVFDPEDDSKITVISDFSIRTGRRVEFFWPNDVFPILQAYTDMGTGIRITSNDELRRFTLNGDVKLRSGEIYYLERNFYIREGTLFFSESEIQFDPRISARAEIRDQIESGPVTISLIIDNAPLMSFSPRFESSPPLSQTEIFSLLGQNTQGEGDRERSIAAAAPFDIAQFVLLRRVQRQVRDILGLDMFSMRTQLFQNVVLQPANDNGERPGRVGNYFDNSTVFIGKYFAAELFGEAMLSLKYDENKQEMGGMVLEPEIGLEMRNPLFDIRFSMVPLHPEFWFISDTSISLIWRRSF